MRRIGGGEVYGCAVNGFVAPHSPDDLLPLVAVVDKWGDHLCRMVRVVGSNEEGVIAEGRWEVWEKWEAGVVVVVGLVGRSVIVDWLFDLLYDRGRKVLCELEDS